MDVRTLYDPADLSTIPPGPAHCLDARSWALTQPDAHIVVLDDDQAVARCSIWCADGPTWPNDPSVSVGRIGHMEVHSHGEALVETALDMLRNAGCGAVLGPMNGSTWYEYRIVTRDAPQGGPPEHPFALEPYPSARVGLALQQAGFVPMARYVSARVAEIPDESEAWEQAKRRLAALGVSVRHFDPDQAERELRAVYELALDAFADNAFYTPSPEESFVSTYKAILEHADPRLILFAERGETLVGSGFAIPDLAQAARREHVDTVVVKTVAVATSERGAGLGSALTLGLHETARSLGMTRAIHALMHEANTSVRISRHTAVPMRRYALLGRTL